MYRVTIEAPSIELLDAQIQALVQRYGAPSVTVQSTPIQEALAEVASEKKPVGRPRKAPETAAAEPAPKAEPKPEAKAEKPKKYTLDQVRSALQTYAQKVDPDASVGILKVRELLAQFQSTKHVPCQKISEVQDQDYAALVAACGA